MLVPNSIKENTYSKYLKYKEFSIIETYSVQKDKSEFAT